MAVAITIESNYFGDINISALAEYGWGQKCETQVHPDAIYPSDFNLYPKLMEWVANEKFISDTTVIQNEYTEEELSQHLSDFDYINDNVLWLWGDLYKGGLGIIVHDAHTYTWASSWGLLLNPQTNKYAYYCDLFNGQAGNDYFDTLSSVIISQDYNFVPTSIAPYEPMHYDEYSLDSTRGRTFRIFSKNWNDEFNVGAFYTLTGFNDFLYTEIPTPYTNQSDWFSRDWAGYWIDVASGFDVDHIPGRLWRSTIAGNFLEQPPFPYIRKGGSIWGGADIKPDPNSSGGGGSSQGGGGSYDDDASSGNTTDDVPSLDVDVLDTGFANLYVPSKSELQSLAQFLFTGITEAASIVLKRLIANPLDYIISLNLCHIGLTFSETEAVKFGGISTNVVMGKLSNQFLRNLNGGSVSIVESEQCKNFLDYSPYTRCQIWIPYCGMHELPIDLIMNATLSLKYTVDLLTGSLTATLYVTRDRTGYLRNVEDAIEDMQLLTFTGNCFEPLPIASTDYRNVVNGVLGLASGAATSIATGNPLPLASSVANATMNSKPNVITSGSIGNCYGYMLQQRAYLILSRPVINVPKRFIDWQGYPSNFLDAIENFDGYLEIDSATLWTGGIKNQFGVITETEADELKNIMEGGIYL